MPNFKHLTLSQLGPAHWKTKTDIQLTTETNNERKAGNIEKDLFVLYLCGSWMEVPSLSRLPSCGQVLGWSGMCECACERVASHCARLKACIASWACEYACTWVLSLIAQPFPRAGVCGCKSNSVCVGVCVSYTDLQAECRPKHKRGSGLCPSYRHASDYHTIQLLPRPQGNNTTTKTGGQRHTHTHKL